VLGVGQVPAIVSKVEPGVSFTVFAVGVGELADEMSFVSALCPGLAEVRADRSG
jgi:hypothetical protein